LDSPGGRAAAAGAEARSNYWKAFFGGDYTVMDAAGVAGHEQGEIFGVAAGLAGAAAPAVRSVVFLAEAGESAYAGGTALSTFRYTTAGETFFHYGYSEQAALFSGGLRPGGFATTVEGLTGAEAKAGLALPHATPPNAVYTVNPPAGTLVRVNPIAEAKFGQSGGKVEFQFPNGTPPGTVSSPKPIQ